MPEPTKEYIVGVDLGGTKILAGVFDSKLYCLGRSKLSTKAGRGPQAVIERIARCVNDAIDECDLDIRRVRGVGIGAPGAADPLTGRIIFAPNLDWKDVPLKEDLQKLLGVPVFIENDCNIQTLGVYAREFKCKPRHLVGIFIGTGIGAGLILDGKLFSGFNRTAGEIGHMVLDVDGPKCNCGNRGCFEALASRTAMCKRILAAVKEGEKTLLADIVEGDMENARSGDLRKAIQRGDKLVEKVVKQSAEYIGVAVANIINLLNPEVIVLGGGVIDALEDEMLEIITKTARANAMTGTHKGIQIVASELGDDAGIVGGAVLVNQNAG